MTQECAEIYTEQYNGQDITIGRPLAEINYREVLYYLRVNKLFDSVFSDLSDLVDEDNHKLKCLPGNGNMNTLLSDFVRNLQVI